MAVTQFLHIAPPQEKEYPFFFAKYLAKLSVTDLLPAFSENQDQFENFIASLSEDQLHYRYAPGKWNIKEILCHLIDTERIFAYRALRIARKDATPLQSFNENEYVENSNASLRQVQDLLEEYSAVRNASLHLYKSFSEEMINAGGIANNHFITVRAIGYLMLAHQQHHLEIIRERYL